MFTEAMAETTGLGCARLSDLCSEYMFMGFWGSFRAHAQFRRAPTGEFGLIR